MFKLTQKQIDTLQKFAKECAKAGDLVEWHEGQRRSSQEIRQILENTGFREGADLSLNDLYQIGKLLTVGLGSTVLSIKGKFSPFEANDLKEVNVKLRRLLYATEDLPERVDSFLDLKFVGIQTVSQFLCKFDYEKYPFFADYMRTVFEYLSIDESQYKEANMEAEREFVLSSKDYHRRTYEYFQFFIILRDIKNELKLKDYLETQNLLWTIYQQLGEEVVHAHYDEQKNGFYIDENIVKDAHKGVLFKPGELCLTLEDEYGIPFHDQVIDGWTDDFEEKARIYLEEIRGKVRGAKQDLMKIIEEFKEWTNTPEAIRLLKDIDNERVDVQNLLEKLNIMDKGSKEFTELVLYALLPYAKTEFAKRVSVFPSFKNIRKFFAPYNYNEEDWNRIARKIFNFAWDFKNNPEKLSSIIENFVADKKYSRRFQSGSLSPILFCLNDRFPVVNNRVRRSFKAVANALGIPEELDQKIEQYLESVRKIKNLISELNIKEFEDFRIFDMFCYWLDSNYVQKGKNLTSALTKKAINLQQLSEMTYLSIEFLKNLESLLTEKGQVILYGPPGTGKTFIAEKIAIYLAGSEERVAKIQFHPSYSYEDFVEGLKPKLFGEKLTYEVISGTFKSFCEKATRSSEPYVFIIDEINRGNIPKIFGELIYCLEYREHETVLPYSGKSFKIPPNLYIIATMNSADRSIALVDYALRRRFYFQELKPDAAVLAKYLTENNCAINVNALTSFFQKINEKIEQKLGKEYTIGHSYFMIKNMNQNKIKRVWDYSIYPLLEEYFFHNKSELEEFEKDFTEFLETV